MHLPARLQALVDDPRQALRVFVVGALIFFVGLSLIVWADSQLAPSLDQEVVALCGTVLTGLGFVTAISMQIFLILNRFKTMGTAGKDSAKEEKEDQD